jgi:hypothetical protein
MEPSTDQLISELTEAFDRLDILDSENTYLEGYIKFLAENLGSVSQMPYPANFTNKPATVVPELRELASKAREMLEFLGTIHQTTILALLDGSAQSNLTSACKRMVNATGVTLTKLHATDDESSIPQNTGGRPRKDRALQVAISLASNYQRLTGKRPLIEVDYKSEGSPAVGDFHRLVDDVFGILQIDASPEFCARQAIKALTEKTSPK